MTGTTIIAGIGCRPGCPAEAIVAVVRRAEALGCRHVTALAAPAFRANEPTLPEAAGLLGLSLSYVPDDALTAAQPRCVTYSVTAERTVGFASVAEGCALAAAGLMGRLLLPRITDGQGSSAATCALAESGVP